MQDRNAGFRLPGTRDRINAEGRIPSTGERAHGVCIRILTEP